MEKRFARTSNGFTLIELLIVIVIMGVLATIGTFAFQSSRKKGNDVRRKEDLAQIAKALEMYNNDYGVYPTANAGLINGTEWGQQFSRTVGTSTVMYMAKLPKDPKNGWEYFYTTPIAKGYVLYARLENTEDPEIITSDLDCGTLKCNYAVVSTNVP